jgi:hypothetical protein
MLQIKWTDGIKNDYVIQKAKKFFFKIIKERRQSWLRHTICQNVFVVNILEGAIYGKKAAGNPRLQYLMQVARNIGADRYTAIERLITIPDGNLPTNQNTKREEEGKYTMSLKKMTIVEIN